MAKGFASSKEISSIATQENSTVKNSPQALTQIADNRPETILQLKLKQQALSGLHSQNALQLKSMAGAYNQITVQRLKKEEEELVQSKFKTTQRKGIEEEQQQIMEMGPVQMKQNKTGLPNNLKVGIENLSGYSMDDVKVHYNSPKPSQLHAHAYAQGADIHVASGQEKHLPHEAWHVVQQKQGRVKPTMQMKGNVNVNDDVGLEREADVMGMKASVNTEINNRPLLTSILVNKRSNFIQGRWKFNGKVISKEEALIILQKMKIESPESIVDEHYSGEKGNLYQNITTALLGSVIKPAMLASLQQVLNEVVATKKASEKDASITVQKTGKLVRLKRKAYPIEAWLMLKEGCGIGGAVSNVNTQPPNDKAKTNQIGNNETIFSSTDPKNYTCQEIVTDSQKREAAKNAFLVYASGRQTWECLGPNGKLKLNLNGVNVFFEVDQCYIKSAGEGGSDMVGVAYVLTRGTPVTNVSCPEISSTKKGGQPIHNLDKQETEKIKFPNKIDATNNLDFLSYVLEDIAYALDSGWQVVAYKSNQTVNLTDSHRGSATVKVEGKAKYQSIKQFIEEYDFVEIKKTY